MQLYLVHKSHKLTMFIIGPSDSTHILRWITNVDVWKLWENKLHFRNNFCRIGYEYFWEKLCGGCVWRFHFPDGHSIFRHAQTGLGCQNNHNLILDTGLRRGFQIEFNASVVRSVLYSTNEQDVHLQETTAQEKHFCKCLFLMYRSVHLSFHFPRYHSDV